ncbi:unnamed protein product [Allacma fusca]|uniref:Uncharacterized protein n=1 Tax=Allacma fusca TaxID=39272 RepID=A0A8J2P4S8_9HEXA|nr:unnamed protein product [Allacma fusca]
MRAHCGDGPNTPRSGTNEMTGQSNMYQITALESGGTKSGVDSNFCNKLSGLGFLKNDGGLLGLSKNDAPTDANNSFSRLQMDQEPSSLSVRSDGDDDLDETNSLDILFPSITFNEDTVKDRLRSVERSIKLLDVEARAEGAEGYQPEGADPGGVVPTTHKGTGLPGRRVTLQIGTKTSPVSYSKPHSYYYNKEKQFVGFAFLENFENSVDHHETACLPMPQDLNPKKRKVIAKVIGKEISTATKNSDLVQSCPKSGLRVYYQNKKKSDEDCYLEEVNDKPLNILYPSISLNEDGANKRLRSATKPVNLDAEPVEKSEAVKDYEAGDSTSVNPNEEIPAPSHAKDFPNLADSHEKSFCYYSEPSSRKQ